MKNIYEILSMFGVTVPEEEKEQFQRELYGNYKSVAELEGKEEKIRQLQQQLSEMGSRLRELEMADVSGMSDQIAQLQQQLQEKEAQHEKILAHRDFSYTLEKEITAAGGKNPKAISALLDLDALQASQEKEKDIRNAISALQKSDGYLFGNRETPPPYAWGTGSAAGAERKAPSTLAGALRERFEKKGSN